MTLPSNIVSYIVKANARLNSVLTIVVVICMAVMTSVVMTNVCCRYVLRLSLTWSAELARYCMVWLAFLGAAVLVNKNQHLAVDVLAKALSKDAKKRLAILVHGLSMVFFMIMAYCGFELVRSTTNQVASSMRFLPMNVVYMVIPVSGLLMFWGSAVFLLRALGHKDP
ncbi:MAG: TRAP transporter small permease [Planctomycetota bacterium]